MRKKEHSTSFILCSCGAKLTPQITSKEDPIVGDSLTDALFYLREKTPFHDICGKDGALLAKGLHDYSK